MRVMPSNRLLVIVRSSAWPPKLPPAPMSATLEAPVVPGSVNRKPSMVTSSAPTRMSSPPATGASVASATRAGLAVSGVVASLGEMPVFGPSNDTALVISTGAASV